MAADEEPALFESTHAVRQRRSASWVLVIIAAVVLAIPVLMFLNIALGRPSCTMQWHIELPPSTQPK
jgi:hypothetical protein